MKYTKDSRYQDVESRQGDADIPHLLWIVLISLRNITIAMCLLIFHQLRQSKVKSMLPSIPDKADVVENIDSISSNLGWFAFHVPIVVCPLFADPITKPKRNIE